MKHKYFRILIFLVLVFYCFFLFQAILIPDSSKRSSKADRTINGFNELNPNTVDILFLGASHVKAGVSPMKIYKDYGICTYVLSTDGQPIEASYFLLKHAYTSQKPKAVVLDVSGLFEKDNSSERPIRWRHVLDNFPLSSLKIEMAKSYSELENGDGMLSALFPIIKYHNRWDSLNQTDFIFTKNWDFYALGEHINSVVEGVTYTTTERINDVVNVQQTDTRIIYFKDNERIEYRISDPLYLPEISERNLEYLLKIKQLCETNNSQLILIKIPVMQFTQLYSSAWTSQKSDMIKNIGTEYDLPFFDLTYDVNIGINWATDTCDGGKHMNTRGAQNVTSALEEYLTNNFDFKQNDNPQYNKYYEYYAKVLEVAMLQSETDFHTYLERLNNGKKKWTILISSYDDFMLEMDDKGYTLLEDLGLNLCREADFRDAYIAIINKGELKYEAVSGRKTEYMIELNDNEFYLGSAGFNVGGYCNISVNRENYAQGGRGLNFVVYDNETGLVIDSVSFDTSLPPMASKRNWTKVGPFLSGYESKLCFKENNE